MPYCNSVSTLQFYSFIHDISFNKSRNTKEQTAQILKLCKSYKEVCRTVCFAVQHYLYIYLVKTYVFIVVSGLG